MVRGDVMFSEKEMDALFAELPDFDTQGNEGKREEVKKESRSKENLESIKILYNWVLKDAFLLKNNSFNEKGSLLIYVKVINNKINMLKNLHVEDYAIIMNWIENSKNNHLEVATCKKAVMASFFLEKLIVLYRKNC